MTEYELVSSLNTDIEKLDEKISNIGNENIIDHSTVKEVDKMIKDIDRDIKRVNRKNVLKVCIKNIKIFGRILQLIFPYLVAAGIAFTGQILLGGDIPFYPQNNKYYATHEETIDYTGVISDESFYDSSSSKLSNTIYYASKWEQREDGKWVRELKEFAKVPKYSIEELTEMAKEKDLDIEKVFGKVSKTKTEVRSSLPEDEIEKDSGIIIINRYIDKDDYIFIREDTLPNIGGGIIFIFIAAVLSLPVIDWRMDASDFSISRHIRRINSENSKIDLSEIKKLFASKKIKFESIVHSEATLKDPITGKKQKIRG